MTDEDPALVDAWVAKHKPEYPIAILGTEAFEDAIGLKFFPFAAVIGPDGKLAYAGSAGRYEDSLEEALDGAQKGAVWGRALAKPAKLMQAGEYGKSYEQVLKLLAGGRLKGRDLAQTEHFRSFLEEQAAAALAEAQDQQKRLVYKAVALLEPIAEADPGFPVSAACRELLAELEALPDFKLEMKGGKAYVAARQAYDDKEYTKAAKAFKKVSNRYEGTRVGATALAEARFLITKRWTGYEILCSKCKKLKRACDKHYEEVKL